MNTAALFYISAHLVTECKVHRQTQHVLEPGTEGAKRAPVVIHNDIV